MNCSLHADSSSHLFSDVLSFMEVKKSDEEEFDIMTVSCKMTLSLLPSSLILWSLSLQSSLGCYCCCVTDVVSLYLLLCHHCFPSVSLSLFLPLLFVCASVVALKLLLKETRLFILVFFSS